MRCHATVGQFVQVGDPLWTIGNWSILWLKVPVFESDADRVMKDMPATLQGFPSTIPVTLPRLSILTEATPGLRTVDLYFEVPNPELSMRPGQSLSVSLSLGVALPMLMLPRSALLYDDLGNTLVYVQDANGDELSEGSRFHRVRVRIVASEGAEVGVLEGIQPNDMIVTTGVESLFAEELRGSLAVQDDD